MKKYILFLLIILSYSSVLAQSFHSKIKVVGLTCAMCSYATHKSLEKLDFIKEIIPDLESASFILEFKEDTFVDFDLIREKVEDAGFFVGSAEIIFNEDILTKNDKHTLIDNNLFHFFSDKEIRTNVFLLVDKNFVSKKEFQKISEKTSHSCYLTGEHSDTCCSHHENLKSEKLFHLKSNL